jgi:hypothetical protein
MRAYSALRPAPARAVVLLGVALSVVTCDRRDPTQPPTDRPFAALSAAGEPLSVEVFIQAHQEDWQLWFGDRVASAAATADKILFIYLTAGDGGRSATVPGYWPAREAAADASIDVLLPAGTWACATPVVRGKTIRRCTKGKSVSYYLRLPDGNYEGQGYGLGSLAMLRQGTAPGLASVDGVSTYASWGDLASTV